MRLTPTMRTTQLKARLPVKARSRRGNATLELSLTLGVLLSLTFGTVEFGHFFFVKNTLQGAAREGVRAAIPSGATSADVTTAVNGALTAAGFNTANFTVTVSPSNISTVAAGSAVSVTVSGTWGTVGLRPLGLIGSAKQVTGAAVMRKEAT